MTDSFILTSDLCDKYLDKLKYPDNIFRDYGKKIRFQGVISTVSCLEDNSKVKEALAEPGNGRVLVVNGGGSLKRALVGDQIASNALKNGWSGVVVHGCIRDSKEISEIDIGIKAISTTPRKTEKRGMGLRDVPVSFASVTFNPGEYLVADEDGIVVGEQSLFAKL